MHSNTLAIHPTRPAQPRRPPPTAGARSLLLGRHRLFRRHLAPPAVQVAQACSPGAALGLAVVKCGGGRGRELVGVAAEGNLVQLRYHT